MFKRENSIIQKKAIIVIIYIYMITYVKNI